jgi:isopenicillin N synthase-like dioxygenase
VKQRIAIHHSRHFRGYTGVGGEITRLQPDLREQIDFGEELEPVAQAADTPAWWGLQGPNQWPAELPQLQSDILAWLDTTRDVAKRLLQAFLVALEQPATALNALVAPPHNNRLKIIHYPGQAQGQSDQGVGPTRMEACSPCCCRTRWAGCRCRPRKAGWMCRPARTPLW